MNACIEVNQVSKKFGSKQVLKDISFTVETGEVFGLLGHNGAGKSTAIDCMLGLKKMENGEVKLLGENPVKTRKSLFEQIGVQLQASSFQTNIKVYEICEEIAALYKETTDYNELLTEFKLIDLKRQAVEKLSGGEKQKLAVVLALIPKPKVLFLDELTTGLDVVARRQVWQTLKALKKNKMTILLTSHYMDEVEELCDRICILKGGKIVVMGRIDEIIKMSPYESLEEAYLWHLGEEVTK